MSPEEMERRLVDGEDPLELSISKWKDIKSELIRLRDKGEVEEVIISKIIGMEHGVFDCALCKKYHRIGVFECRDFFFRRCPIYKKIGETKCRLTPYSSYKIEIGVGDIKGMLNAIDEEISFLESLRK